MLTPKDTTLSHRVLSYAVSTVSRTYSFANLFGTREVQVFGVISNLFDRDPPLAVGRREVRVAFQACKHEKKKPRVHWAAPANRCGSFVR